jgi:PAS domain S-box-containing protein
MLNPDIQSQQSYFVIYDAERNIKYISLSMAKLTGKKIKDVIGKRAEEILPEIVNEQYLPTLLDVIQTKKIKRLEYSSIIGNHEIISRASFIPLLDKQGNIYEILCVLRDITHTRQVFNDLLASEERFKFVAEASHMMVYDISIKENKFLALTGFSELLGYEPEPELFIVDWWLNHIHPDDLPMVTRTQKDAIKKGNDYQITYRLRHKKGHYITVEDTAKIVRNKSGEAIRIVAGVFDITERKKVNDLKDEFIGMVSHELRTPLTMVIAAIKTARTKGVTLEEIDELLSDADFASESLAQLLDNLVELSRYQAKRLQLNKKIVDIIAVVKKMVYEREHRSPDHRFSIAVHGNIPSILADELRLELILRNLLINAVKYSPAGSAIITSIKINQDSLMIGVKDHGKGISMENQRKLFTSFERLAESSTTSTGLGLGLLVCKRLVEAHGGKIWVESAPEKGSTFTFTLPT